MAQVQQQRIQKRKLGQKLELMPQATESRTRRQHQVIAQQNSFLMVQTLLFSAVSNIAFMRKFFPGHCFEKRYFADIRNEAYQTYCKLSGHNSLENHINDKPKCDSTALMVLSPGKADDVDRLLTWLYAILEGLLKKDLFKVQISIFTDRERPSDVIESYTFSFGYHENSDNGDGSPTNLALEGPNSEQIIVDSSSCEVEKIIDYLNLVADDLPDLPRDRFLACYLFHKPRTSIPYLPSGFHICENPVFPVLDDDTHQARDHNIGMVNTNFHSVGISLAYTSLSENKRSEKKEKSSASKRLVQDRASSHLRKPSYSGKESPTRTLSQRLIDLPQDSVEANKKQRSSRSTTNEEDIGKRVNGSSPESGQGSGELWDLDYSSIPNESTVLTQELSTNFHQQGPPKSWRLIPSKQDEVDRKKRKHQRRLEGLNPGKDVVCCECDYDADEGLMVCCDCCGTWQHCPCYGFLSRNFQKADEHYCYTCLLAETDQPRLKRLKKLTYFRRALWTAYEHGFPRARGRFAKLLRYSEQTTAELVLQMKDEGYLTRGINSGLTLVDSVEQRNIRLLDYGNPMTLIRSYYIPQEEIEDWRVSEEEAN